MSNKPVQPTREELAKLTEQNQRLIRAFEMLFSYVTTGGDINELPDYIMSVSQSLVDNSSSNTATLTNSPVPGNPSKWIAINDNGVVRYIPTW